MFHEVNPLTDVRWQSLVETHPHASVFHTTAWLNALQLTYGFEPVAYVDSLPGEEPRAGIVFCRVGSWLTGNRLVSLPFADHCDLMVSSRDYPTDLESTLAGAIRSDNLRYVEVRPLAPIDWSPFQPAARYLLHILDLAPDLGTLFRGFHESSTQRRIRRAERSGLVLQSGRSESILEQFYHLLVLTRRRHRIPPQPKTWFRNLIGCFQEALQIRVASLDGQPVAAILTIRHRDTLVYKYGCSDPRYRSLGGTHLLFWKAIQEAKADGLRFFDLGRSAIDHHGLITFKDRWGSMRMPLTYLRFVNPKFAGANYRPDAPGWGRHLAGRALSCLPACLLDPLSRVIYRHAA